MSEENKPFIRSQPHARVEVDPEKGTIRVRWTGYAPSESYRATLMEAFELVRAHHLKYWLADLRDMGAILRHDEQWTVKEWFPLLAKAGLARMAIITSVDFFNQMSVDRIMDASEPFLGFEVAYFDAADAAAEWLFGRTPAAV